MEKNAPPPGFVDPPPYTPYAKDVHAPPVIPPDAQVTIINQRIEYGPETQRCVCPYCHNNIQTRIESEANSRTHCMALLCCLLCWPFAWLPYCMDSCQSTNHYCPHCNAFLGSYQN